MATTAIYDTTQPILTKRTTVVMFLHMKTVQVNSLNKQEDNKHIIPLWLATCPRLQSWHRSRVQCHTPYIYRLLFGDQRPELPMMMITRYGNSLVSTTESYIAVLLTGCQVPQKAMFQVTDTRGYLIAGTETVRKLGYIHCLKITPPRLIQHPKMIAHLRAVKTKTSRQQGGNEKYWGLRHSRIQLLDAAVLINGRDTDCPSWKSMYWKNIVIFSVE